MERHWSKNSSFCHRKGEGSYTIFSYISNKKKMEESLVNNLVAIDYTPNIFLPISFLFLAFLCVLINSTILFKLLLKPKLWTLVNLFLSLLLGKIFFFRVYIFFID